jgi:hypothetical protein
MFPKRRLWDRAPLTGRRASLPTAGRLERFPITWNHVIDKESLKIKMLEQVLIEKVCQLFRNLL